MLNIVLFGPPGAGKGTQSENLIKKYQLVHLSTGDILRSEIAAGTQLGIEAKMLMDAGILVPDEVVIGMISSKLDQNKDARGFIFDGFPRTTAQAEALDKLLYQKHTSITMMLALEVNNEELTKRLLMRGRESGRADDQNESIIRNRIEEYNNKTTPLKEYYSNQNKYRTVNGIGTVDDIFKSLCAAIEPTQRRVIISDSPSERKAEKKVVEKTEKKVVPKESPVIEKVAPKAVVKVAPKTVAKAAPKKTAKAPAKKVVKKAPVKKAAPKKAVKKTAPKKAVKKVVKKTAAKKPIAKKKIVKKAAPKKAVKKAVAKKASKPVKKSSKPVKKAVAKKVVKKAAKKTSKKKK